jgi:hypothetical protein
MYGATSETRKRESESLLFDDAQGVIVTRIQLISELQARVVRANHCRSLPFSILLYILFILSILFRSPVGTSFDFERR